MNKSHGFTIRIHVHEGDQSGLRIIEKSNWVGLGVIFPRSNYSKIKNRPELDRSGVYFLLEKGSSSELPKIYIGEGDIVKNRLDSHYSNKDFWTDAIVFTSKNDQLNKAQVRYLESRLVTIAQSLKRCRLENSNSPKLKALSEMDAAEVEGFLEEMLVLLPILGINAFENPTSQKTETSKNLYCKGGDSSATGWESASGFVVSKGSKARVKETDTFPNTLSDLRQELLKEGIIEEKGKSFAFTQDYEFTSPSYAATMIRGMRSNGRTAWKNKSGKTLKELQQSEV